MLHAACTISATVRTEHDACALHTEASGWCERKMNAALGEPRVASSSRFKCPLCCDLVVVASEAEKFWRQPDRDVLLLAFIAR